MIIVLCCAVGVLFVLVGLLMTRFNKSCISHQRDLDRLKISVNDQVILYDKFALCDPNFKTYPTQDEAIDLILNYLKLEVKETPRNKRNFKLEKKA